jgi:hypothetical protein
MIGLEPIIGLDGSILSGWFYGLVFVSLIISVLTYRVIGVLPALGFFYFSLSALRVFAYADSRYVPEALYYIPLCYSSLLAYAALLSMTGAAFCLRTLHIKECLPVGMMWLGVINSLVVLWGYKTGEGLLWQGIGYSGFLNYSGMNGTLIAYSIPFFLCTKQSSLVGLAQWAFSLIGLCLCGTAIILSKSSIPYGVVSVTLLAIGIHRFSFKKISVIMAAAIPLIVGALVDFHGLRGLLDSGYRFTAYRTFMKMWWIHDSHLWGSGFGTFLVLGKIIQNKTGFMNGFIWNFMHSDILQILFETGFVGLILFTALVTQVGKRLYKQAEPQFFALFCGIISSALFDFPFRHFIIVFISLAVAIVAYSREKCQKIS